ncbi:MAG: DUF2330 domain-containing protein, partial [Candidatus Thermoplasmatota archaeon]|nr:DUF2330 domain-containing protein [Candidatus Thermoplasmatota archaeon]
MMKLKRIMGYSMPFILGFILLFQIPIEADGDGCYIPVGDFHVYEPGQNALICWNGTVERMYLSVNIWGNGESQGVHFVPFPSEPKVSLGNASMFENLTDVFEGRLRYNWNWDPEYPNPATDSTGHANGPPSDGISIILEDTLGIHDVVVIKVKSIEDLKESINQFLARIGMGIEYWPEELETVIERYVSRGFPYFALDRFPITREMNSIDPLIYEFRTDEPVFPLEISSILNGTSKIQLGLMVPDDIPLDLSGTGPIEFESEGHLTSVDINEIDADLASMFDSGCHAIYFNGRVDLQELSGDFMIKRNLRADWMTTFSSYESFSGINEEGERYHRILTSKGFWYDGTAELRYIDASNGNTIWTTDGIVTSTDTTGWRDIYLTDLDNDNIEEIFVKDYNQISTFLSRLDPSTGSVIWSYEVDDGSLGENLIRRLMGPLGNNYILLETDDLFIVLNMETGDLRSRMEMPYAYSYHEAVEKIPSLSGDLVFYLDTYESTMNIWD